MKRFQVFFLLSAFIFFTAGITGCGKEKSNERMLIGVWKVKNYDGATMQTPWIIEFKKGGVYYESLTILEEDIEYDGKWKWGSSHEIILVEIENSTEEFTITKLTDNDLWYLDIDNKTWELNKL